MTLEELKPGQDAYITAVECQEPSLRKHILDMGLTPGTEVTMVKAAPLGDPLELRLRGYELTLRKADAAMVQLSHAHPAHAQEDQQTHRWTVPHPGVGETVTYRGGKAQEKIRAGEPIRFALAGNQNCGKTTLFRRRDPRP